jgi:spore coat protein U-like protein
MNTLRTSWRVVLAAVLASVATAPGRAATSGGSFQVNATIVSACTVSGSTLTFGASINPLTVGVPLDSTSTLTVQCTNTTPYSVSLNAGANAGGASNFAARAMKNGTYSMGYQLYTDTGRSSIWGDGTGTSVVSQGTGSGSNQSLTVYGRVSSLLGAVPGTYTDTVTVTITY